MPSVPASVSATDKRSRGLPASIQQAAWQEIGPKNTWRTLILKRGAVQN
ncbi:hypothetical protein [Dictyobacter aurantiacus]|nr:hypothetical protein [Dictyobacter aurantiacus]